MDICADFGTKMKRKCKKTESRFDICEIEWHNEGKQA